MVAVAGRVLLDMLSPPARVLLASVGQRKTYADGEMIHSRGDKNPTMGVVIKGQVRLGRLHVNGSQTFVTLIQTGQHFGDVLFMSDRIRTHDAMAKGRVEIDHYDHAAFELILENKEILQTLYVITSTRLAAVMAMNDDLRGLPREVHLAKVLLHQWRQFGQHEDVPCVQEDLAGLLGISTMTLSKGLALLKREGLIETGYKRIRILDPKRLDSWLADRSAY